MASELGKYEIRCNSIAPGYIKTGIGADQGMTEEMKARMAQVDAHFSAKTPIHRAGTIEDFEGIGAFLTSDASSFVSGDTIFVDGASHIHAPYAFN
jgi:NAD(P)-dependent dehydrogenase (short-subunit alcohol dehydrogenase family)